MNSVCSNFCLISTWYDYTFRWFTCFSCWLHLHFGAVLLNCYFCQLLALVWHYGCILFSVTPFYLKASFCSLFLLSFFFKGRVSMLPWNSLYIDQTGLEFTKIHLLLSLLPQCWNSIFVLFYFDSLPLIFDIYHFYFSPSLLLTESLYHTHLCHPSWPM